MEVGKLSYEEFKKLAGEQSILDSEVGQEEWERHAKDKKWSLSTALVRIRNERKGVAKGGDRAVKIGFPLGGRDFVYRGIDIDDAKSQFVSFLTDEGELIELTQFGHFKGSHMRKAEVEFETTTKQGKDPTVTFTNHNVRSVTIHDQRITPERLAKLARPVGEIKDTDLYRLVIFEGHMTRNFEREPIWGESDEDGKGTIADHYSLIYNKQPCFQFQMWGSPVSVRVSVSPTKFSEKIIGIPDIMALVEGDSIDELPITLTGKRVIVVGCLRSFEKGDEVCFASVDTTLVIEHPEQTEYILGAVGEGTGKERVEERTGETAGPKNILEDLKKKVAEAYAALGDSMTPQSVRELVDIPERVSDAVLKKLIEKQMESGTKVENSEVDNFPTDLEGFIIKYIDTQVAVNGMCPFIDLINEAESRGHKREDAEEMVNDLQAKGDIIEVSLGMLKRT